MKWRSSHQLEGAALRLVIGHLVLSAAPESPAAGRIPARSPNLRMTHAEHVTVDRDELFGESIAALLSHSWPLPRV